jgi:fatty-acyl-CoA synthase
MALPIRIVRNPQDVEALEQGPWDAVVREQSVYELLRNTAEERTGSLAITFLPTGALEEEPVQITYGELIANVTRAANMFNDLGAGATDTISFLLPSIPEAQFTFWGAQAAGIANPINYLLKPDQIVDLLNAAETKILVALGLDPVLDIWQRVEAVREKVPSLKAILKVGGPGDTSHSIFAFNETLAKYPADYLKSRRKFSRSDIATYFHTGGTTGSPKLAPHTQGNTIYAIWVVANMWGFDPSAININPLPMFHVAGSIVNSISPFCAGARIIIPTSIGFRNLQFLKNHWKLVEKYRPTHIGGIPTSLVSLLAVPTNGADLSSVKVCTTGGTALPTEVHKQFESVFGIPVRQMYGMTEAGSVVAINPAFGEARIGCAGLKLPYEEIRVVRIGSQRAVQEECRPNEAGVIMLKGPNIFPGFKDPLMNEGVLTVDGWLNTGDVGYMDENGGLYLTGRSKDLIIRSGHNIDPSTIEEAVQKHPAVAMSAAVGRPDHYAGELPVVFVQLKAGASVTEKELMEFVADRIAEPPARPKEVIFIEQMPLTAVGKIFKPQLRWDLIAREFTNRLAPLKERGMRVSVKAEEDKHHGTLVTVNLSPSNVLDREEVENEIKSVSGAFYYIKVEINWH